MTALTPVEVDGMALLMPEREAAVFARFEFEQLTCDLLLETLPVGGVMVDVGAHVGMVTLRAARHVGPSGRVHSIEPTPANGDALLRNAAANGLDNVTLHRCAAGRARATAVLHEMGLSYLNSLVGANPYNGEQAAVEVPVEPLDELVDGRVDALKIDVEGAELEVLEGAARVLAENPQATLCVEWNPMWMRQAGRQPLELLDALAGCGFRPTLVADESRRVVVPVDEIWPSVAARADDHWWGNVLAYGPDAPATRRAG